MSTISILPLGAGQDVGRSCIVASFSSTGRSVMLDCGMHMGYSDARMFPDFGFLSAKGSTVAVVDAVLVSHFHLDHCGALPAFCKSYRGPVVMTQPTRALCPILLEDFRKLAAPGRRGNTSSNSDWFTQNDIASCLARATTIEVGQTLDLAPDLQVTAYYAGHVLGAVMFLVRSGPQSLLYTGDYNMTPDRHLGGALIPYGLAPDIVITESTYATTVRDSRRARERDFLRKVHDTLQRGGNVLVPVFAVGRAQELAVLLDTYAARMGWTWPMYFTGGLTRKSMEYYRLFVNWTNPNLRSALLDEGPGHTGNRNPFDFTHISTLPSTRPADLDSILTQPGGMVIFSSPGMLHSGLSLDIFTRWAGDARNMVILPGYCVPGTVGAQLLAGPSEGERIIKVPASDDAIGNGAGSKPTTRDVVTRMRVANLSFSAHADGKGIIQLLKAASPSAGVVLVHGDRVKMPPLRDLVHRTVGVPCYMPPNHRMLAVPTRPVVRAAAHADVRGAAERACAATTARRAVDAAVGAAAVGAAITGRHRVATARTPPLAPVSVAIISSSSAAGKGTSVDSSVAAVVLPSALPSVGLSWSLRFVPPLPGRSDDAISTVVVDRLLSTGLLASIVPHTVNTTTAKTMVEVVGTSVVVDLARSRIKWRSASDRATVDAVAAALASHISPPLI
ncbi:beta-lactamase-like protein [Blastocladiella britannica]|nr:beta-lactamase-like protein [Blastocladiella britannica]